MTADEYREAQKMMGQMQMSETMQMVGTLAQDMPLDMQDAEDRKTLFVTCLVDTVSAIDDGEITFSSDEARGITLALLAGVYILLNGGPVSLEEATKQ